MKRLLLHLFCSALSIYLAAWLIEGVDVPSVLAALWVAVVLGILNTLVRPVLILLTLPATLLTLGLFILVINGVVFWLASELTTSLHVASFGDALLGSLVVSVINWILSASLGAEKRG